MMTQSMVVRAMLDSHAKRFANRDFNGRHAFAVGDSDTIQSENPAIA